MTDLFNQSSRSSNEARGAEYEPIAIVGIGCRFPGAHGPLEYWRLLLKGESQAKPMPKEPEKRRWNNDHFYDPSATAPGKITHKTVCLLEQFDRFDSEFFRLNPKEATEMDPQHRLLLETTYESLEDAGWSLEHLTTPNNNVGVFVGAYAPDWTVMGSTNMKGMNNYTTQGRPLFMMSNRISHWFGLEGPSLTVDTACSSSLSAIHLACRALQQGECRVAFACGANLLVHPFFSVGLSRQDVFSKDGVLRAFDKHASGYVRGEGFGTLVLKPASQAVADGDRIYALVRGSMNYSGGNASKILTKPNVAAEIEMMKKAMKIARVNADEIRFVEAHGTGTPVGDAIELQAISDAYRPIDRDPSRSRLKIGSVKSLIGHLEPASGVASVIKMALSLHYGAFTPNANYNTPNDVLVGKELEVQTVVEPIQANGMHTLVGVNSFGIGGTLSHAILQASHIHTEWKKRVTDASDQAGWTLNPLDSSRGKRLFFPISAASKAALQSLLSKWRRLIEKVGKEQGDTQSFPSESDLLETEFLTMDASIAAHSLCSNRTHLPFRVLLSGASCAEFLQDLDSALTSMESVPRNALQKGAQTANVLFVFPGQGPQCIWMATRLYERFPAFQDAVRKVDALFCTQMGESVIEKMNLFKGRAPHPSHPQIFQDPMYCQSAIFMVQVGLVELLKATGISPGLCLGHSAGEVAASWASGLITLEEAVTVALARAATLRELFNRGGMLVLFANEEKSRELMQSVEHGPNDWFCEIGALNSNESTTLTGNQKSLLRVKEAAQAAGVRAVFMRTTTPYHSNAIEPFKEVMEARLASFNPIDGSERLPTPLFSSVLGREFDRQRDVCDLSYWWTNTRCPVNFYDALRDMWKNTSSAGQLSVDYIVEIANHPVLGNAVLDVFQETKKSNNSVPIVVNPMFLDRNEVETFHDAVKRCYELGSNLKWDNVQPTVRPSQPLATLRLPQYTWNHETSLWVESKTSENIRYGKTTGPKAASSIQSVGGPYELSLEVDEFLKDHVVNDECVFPAAGYLVTALRCVAVSEGAIRGAPPPSVVLDDIAFHNPLILSAETENPLLLSWPKDGSNISRFTYSNPKTSTVFCSGTVNTMTMASTSMSFEGLQAPVFDESATGVIESNVLYANLKTRGLNYGPAFQNIKRAMHCAGLGMAIMRGIPSDSRCFDIGVLDSCFQLCIVLVRDDGNAYVPNSIRRYVQLFQPTADHDLLVEAHALGRQRGTIRFDIRIWETARDGGSERLCAVVEELAVSPLGGFSKDEGFTYETVYQPPGVSVNEWNAIAHSVASCPRHMPKTGNIPDGQAQKLIGDWSIGRTTMGQTPRSMYEKYLLEETKASPVSTGRQTFHLEEGNEEFGVIATQSLVSFQDKRLFEYLPNVFNDIFNAVRLLSEKHPVLRIAVLVPRSDSLLVKAFSDALSEAERWWSNMELVFYFIDGDVADDLSPEVRQVLRENGLSSRSEVVHSVDNHILNEYDVGDFQALLSVNFHRVSDLNSSLRHFLRLLAPSGIFLSAEATEIFASGLLTVAAHESWWSFTDKRKQSRSWLTVEAWKEILAVSGFSADSFVSSTVSESDGCTMSFLASRLRQSPNSSTGKCFFATAGEVNDITHSAIDSIASSCSSQDDENSPVVDITSEEYSSISSIVKTDPESRFVFFASDEHVSKESPSVAVWNLMELLTPILADQGGRVVVVLAGDHPNCDAIVGLCRAINHERKANLQVLWLRGNDKPLQNIPPVPMGASQIDAIVAALTTQQYVDQSELCHLNGEWCSPKIVRSDMEPPLLKDNQGPLEQRNWHLEIPRQVGNADPNINDAFFGQRPFLSRKPPTDHVRISVRAVGLNFKHSMILLGMLPGFDLDHAGGECAGVIESVGDEAHAAEHGLKVGDKVVAMLRSCGIGTVVDSHAEWTFKIPDGMTFEDAASIPVCTSTAYLGLVKMARVEKGERVLIHSAAGGVGLAAIQVVQMRGGEVIASVSSEKKRRFLREKYNVEHFVPSRSLDFEKEVMTITKGQGVDVVLNSLAGEALKAGVRCLAFGGRFVEIGKIDILGNGKLPLSGFEQNLSFLSCHIDKLLDHPEKTHALLKEMFDCFYAGRLRPLPHTVHHISEALTLAKSMTQGEHIGKIVFCVPLGCGSVNDESLLFSKATMERRLRPDATYLITGGLGSVGLSIAEQMARSGARTIVLVGRNPPSTVWQRTTLTRIEELGTSVIVELADVGDLAVVKDLLSRYSSAKWFLRGVISAAGVTDDSPLAEMNPGRVEAVMRPKADGALNLHHATKTLGIELDFFLMTSSLVASVGNLSQTNYAASNMFLAGLMRARLAEGLPASVIDLGAVEGEFGSGMIQSSELIDNLASRGLLTMNIDQAAFGHLGMMTPGNWRRHLVYGKVRWMYGGAYASITRRYTHLAASGIAVPRALKRGTLNTSWRDVVRTKIVHELSSLLQMAPDDIDADMPLATYGLDSLGSVQLISFLKSEARILATQFDILGNATINSLLDRLPENVGDVPDENNGAVAERESRLPLPPDEDGVGKTDKADEPQTTSAKRSAGDRLGTYSKVTQTCATPGDGKPKKEELEVPRQRTTGISFQNRAVSQSGGDPPTHLPNMKSFSPYKPEKNIGILAMEYFSSDHVVKQSDMEKSRGDAATGYFTEGFGQDAIPCMKDHTNVPSLALSSLSKLFHTTGVSPARIGYLAVGSESNPDRSKSIKSILMTLFEESGNFNVEGVDHVSACYGGAAALFDAMAWMESSSWDGRLAVVVATDAALIEPPDDVFNGHGSIALLLGPDAPVRILPKRHSYHRDSWDFYQPVALNRSTPIVQFANSIECYLSSLEKCRDGFCSLYGVDKVTEFSKYLVMHGPNVSMMRKGFRRLLAVEENILEGKTPIAVQKFGEIVGPSLPLVKNLGSLYTASVFAGIYSLLYGSAKEVSGERVAVYSYGSGLGATMFALEVSASWGKNAELKKEMLWRPLQDRVEVTPMQSIELLGAIHERDHLTQLPFKPQSRDYIAGAWYLQSINEEATCTYHRPVPFNSEPGSMSLAMNPPISNQASDKPIAEIFSNSASNVRPTIESFYYDPEEDPLLSTDDAIRIDNDGLLVYETSKFVVIVLNRPEKGNTFDSLSLQRILEAVKKIGERIVILRGSGSIFSGGLDISGSQMKKPDGVFRNVTLYQEVLSRLDEHTQPVITVCHGHCLAGGTGFAAVADVVISHRHCKFGLPEIDQNLLPTLVSVYVAKRVQKSVVRELALTGREVSASEAQMMGLVSIVTNDLNSEVHRLVNKLSRSNKELLSFGKKHLPASDNDSAKALMAILMNNGRPLLQDNDEHRATREACLMDLTPEGVAILSINTSDAAITPSLSQCFEALVIELKKAVVAGTVRSIILRSNKEHFCTGGDMSELSKWLSSHEMTTIGRSFDLYVSFMKLRDLKVPIVAGFKGKVVGAGIGVGMLGDVRVCTKGTSFDLAFFRHNISPGMGTTATLAKVVGPEAFLDMMSGTVIDSRRAASLGIVQEIVSGENLDNVLMERALRFARTDPRAVQRTVLMVRSPVDRQNLLREATNQGTCFAELARVVTGENDSPSLLGHIESDVQRTARSMLPASRESSISTSRESSFDTSASSGFNSTSVLFDVETPIITGSDRPQTLGHKLVACFGGYAQSGSGNSDLQEVERLHHLIHTHPWILPSVLKLARECDKLVQTMLRAETGWLQWVGSMLAYCWSWVQSIFFPVHRRGAGGKGHEQYPFYGVLQNPNYAEAELHPYYTAASLVIVGVFNVIVLQALMKMKFSVFKRSFSHCCALSFGHFAALTFASASTEHDMIEFTSKCSLPLAIECAREFHRGRPKSWSVTDSKTNLVVKNVNGRTVGNAVAVLNENLPPNNRVHVSIKMTPTVTIVTGFPPSLKRLKSSIRHRASVQFSYIWLPTLPHTPYGEAAVARLLRIPLVSEIQNKLSQQNSRTRIPFVSSDSTGSLSWNVESILRSLFVQPVDWVSTSSCLETILQDDAMVYFGPGDDKAALSFKANLMESRMISAVSPCAESRFLESISVLVSSGGSQQTSVTDTATVETPVKEDTSRAVSTRESLQTGALAAKARYPKAYPRSQVTGVPTSNFVPSAFVDYKNWRQKMEQARSARLRFPYFVEHDSVIQGTTHIGGRTFVDYSAYNYLGLAGDKEVGAAATNAIQTYGTSVSASRFASGERSIHRQLETELADFIGCEDCLVFSAGFLAISSAIVTLGQSKSDLIIYDSLSHRSAVEGVMASSAQSMAFPHNDCKYLDDFLWSNRNKYRRVVVVVEGSYSMDGDIPDLPTLVQLRQKHSILLMVDEAHSLGCCGKTGRGLGEHFGIGADQVDVWAGTLSKSLASCGGYLAGGKEMVEYFKVNSPGFLFSAGITPANTAAALAALKKLIREPDRVTTLQARSKLFLSLAKSFGLDTMQAKGESAVIPVMIGNLFKAMAVAERLYDLGIHVQPIGSPAVAEGSERLRFFISAMHTEQQIRTTVKHCAELIHETA